MMAGNRIGLLVLFYCTLFTPNVASKMIIQIKNVDVTTNLKFANASVMLRKYGADGKKTAVDFRAEVFQPIPDAMVSTVYYVPNLLGNYEKSFYNRTVNFCTYLRQPLTDRILKMIYEHLSNRGNVPKRCPVANGTYNFKTGFEGVQLPGFLPESSFRFDLNFQRGPPRNELLFKSHWFGELRREP